MDLRQRVGPSGRASGDRRGIRRGLLTTAALAALVATILPGVAPATRAEDLTLRIGATYEQNTSNIEQCCMDNAATQLTYDGLAAVQADGSLKPEYAESWSISPDGLTWTFKIRAGMRWSDGETADANDAAFTLNYMIKSIGDPNEQNQGLNNTYYWQGDTVTAPDPLTLVIKTKVPTPNLLYNSLFILPEHIWKDVTYEQALKTFQIEPPVVGSGPFVLTEWKHGQYVRLTRNEYYWGQKPALKDILVIYYKSVDAETQALQAGEIDFAPTVNIGQFDALSKVANVEAISAQTTWQSQLFFNAGSPDGVKSGANTDATTDAAFRDAIGYAIDQQAIVDKVYGGHAQPGVGFVAPVDSTHYTGMPGVARHFDLTEAAARLDAAGYKLGADGVRTDKAGKPLALRMLVYPDPPQLGTAAQFVVGWLDQVGVKVTPVSLDPAAFYDSLNTKRAWELALTGTSSPGIPLSLISIASTLPSCTSCWHAPAEYTDLYTQYQQTTDPAKAADMVKQMDQIFYQAAPYIVLAYPDMIQAHRTDKFTGWIRTPEGTGPYAALDTFIASYPLFTNLAPVGSATPAPSAEPSAVATDAPSGVASVAPAASAAPAGPSGSGDNTGTIVGVVVVIVAVAAGALILRRRRSAA